MSKVTFLGTGLMGSALAEAAAKRGDEVRVWNRTRAKAEPLGALGITLCDSPAAAVRGAERVHTVLPDDTAVDSVLAACGDALEEVLIVDHSTVSPVGTRKRFAALEGRGIAFLHAPVFMSPTMCRRAEGLMLAVGPLHVFELARHALEQMTGKLEYLGERRDLAAAYKLFGNAMLISITAGLADVYGMAKALNISAADAHALFGKFNPAGVINYRGLAMSKGDYTPQFELQMARKDVRLAVDAAGGEALAVLPAVAARMDALIKRGFGSDDMGVLAVDAVRKA